MTSNSVSIIDNLINSIDTMAEAKSDDCANLYRIKAVPKTKPTKEDNFELITGQKLEELKDNEISSTSTKYI